MATHMALLVPHLGGKAYPLRSAIVMAAGHLLIHAFSDASDHAPDGSAGLPLQPTACRPAVELSSLEWAYAPSGIKFASSDECMLLATFLLEYP